MAGELESYQKNRPCDRTEKRGRGASCTICNITVDRARSHKKEVEEHVVPYRQSRLRTHTSTTFSIALDCGRNQASTLFPTTAWAASSPVAI